TQRSIHNFLSCSTCSHTCCCACSCRRCCWCCRLSGVSRLCCSSFGRRPRRRRPCCLRLAHNSCTRLRPHLSSPTPNPSRLHPSPSLPRRPFPPRRSPAPYSKVHTQLPLLLHLLPHLLLRLLLQALLLVLQA